MTLIRSLSEIANVFNGKTPSKAEQRSSGHPVLKIKNVSETGGFKGAFESFVDSSLAAKYQSRWIHAGDSLILNAAHNADYVASKTFFAGEAVRGAMPTGEWLVVRPNPEVADPAFINFWLRSARTRKAIKFLVKGIHLYPKDVATLPVPLPSLAEQRRIVDLLSRAEGIVRLRREAEKKAAELIPALFLDMFGDPARNPKGWPVASVGSLCSVQTGATPSRDNPAYFDGDVPWVKTTEVSGDIITRTGEHISQQALAATNCKLFPVGTILVAMYGQGQTRGRSAVLGIEAATNQACAAILPSRAISVEFLFRFLQTQYEQLRSLAQGGNQANLNLSIVKNYAVILPPVELQAAFAERAEQVRSVQSQQSVATAKAQATFDALLAQAFQPAHVNSVTV